MRKWILWIPVLMVGSMVYWTIALSFGNLSLLALSTYTVGEFMDDHAELRDSYQPITVQISGPEEAATSDDDDDALVVDVVSDQDRADVHNSVRSGQPRATDSGPGETAF